MNPLASIGLLWKNDCRRNESTSDAGTPFLSMAKSAVPVTK
jgi:hypothetical protein